MSLSDATRIKIFDVLRHAVITMAFCCVIAVALAVSGRGRWDVQMVYSLSIGLVSFAVIDGGWWLIARGEGKFWNRGWHGAALVVLGTSVGFVVGTRIGDAYSGESTWQLLSFAPSKFLSIVVISLIATVVVAYFFFSRGTARALEAQVAIAERDASEAKLRLLETQLEPHMLFNTLANLRALIQLDPPRAIAMLDHLNNYLRVTLAGSRALSHPLSAEFARLGDFLELMSIRMGPRLRYTLDLPDDLRDVPVPPLLLQPLVENAIRHGLEPQVEGGEITVRARRDTGPDGETRITIEVNDTGVGLGAAPASDGSSFGVAQVRERLAATFGSRSAMNLVASPVGGTSATVTFPL
ncbi:sensor histidine kinase [Variovorax sp. PAMC 28711]|uniref:sensor histidine kinase n=1 Tax=Variovorax sp. PAMC 28711 TaxID=1795631 RepID=UPI00078DDEC2|nr:histidine kinase [Variovorax sp. PAMC 28711]AMM23393.1 histidine kinase [Variovorax sp. PAMC 28711]